jgi:hypothetical protein
VGVVILQDAFGIKIVVVVVICTSIQTKPPQLHAVTVPPNTVPPNSSAYV